MIRGILRKDTARSGPGETARLSSTTRSHGISAAKSGAGGLRCALTRQPWEEISLTGRTQKARRDGASLFISVHHDSVPEMFCARKSGLPGCTTDHASGWSVFVSKKNAQYGKSLEAAAMAGRRLMESGLSFNPTHTGPGERRPFLDRRNGVYGYDNLIVLKTAGMPAFLIETAVITNPADMRKLTGSD